MIIVIFTMFRPISPPSSGVSCQTREPTRNFELLPLFNPWGVACSGPVNHNRVQVLSIPVLLFVCSQEHPHDCLLEA